MLSSNFSTDLDGFFFKRSPVSGRIRAEESAQNSGLLMLQSPARKLGSDNILRLTQQADCDWQVRGVQRGELSG